MSGRRAGALAVALVAGACSADLVGPPAVTRYVAVAAGGAHSCALDEAGAAWCWGSNTSGQLGLGSGRSSTATPAAVAGGHVFRVLVAGERHTCAIDEQGGGWCWGANDGGQLGDRTWRGRSEPSRIGISRPLSRVAAGVGHGCATDFAGRVWCWGRNDGGQLGADGGTGTNAPVLVRGATTASAVAVGAGHSCALGTGGVFCWGSNEASQLGGATLGSTSLPVRVSAPGLVHDVAAGAAHGCALTAAASAVCWGDNRYGQLGLIGLTESGTAVPVALDGALTAIAASPAGHLTCAAGPGGAWCWGGWIDRRLGLIRRLPGAIPGLDGPVDAVAVGGRHACFLVRGAVACWGSGESGQLGNGRRSDVEEAVPLDG